MGKGLTLRGIEELKAAEEKLEATPEFAKMVIRHRDETCSGYSKVSTRLSFPCAGVMLFVDHSDSEATPKLVLLNLNMGGCVGDVLRVELTDLPPEEVTDEDV